MQTGSDETASDHQTGCKAGKWNAGPANVCTLCVGPGPMASAHIAKAIAATINAKPIWYFIGEPSSNSWRKHKRSSPAESVMEFTKRNRFLPTAAQPHQEPYASSERGAVAPSSGRQNGDGDGGVLRPLSLALREMTNLGLRSQFPSPINARRSSFDSSHKRAPDGTSGPCHYRTYAVQKAK